MIRLRRTALALALATAALSAMAPWHAATAVASVASAVAAPMGVMGLWAQDPWYQDVGGHWSNAYVRPLWEAGVTDGFLDRRFPFYPRAWFYPDLTATRAEYVVSLAKTFGLSPNTGGPQAFTDVTPLVQVYGGKPGYGYIQVAARDGLAQALWGARFYPGSPITRQDAVAMLIRALGLGPAAQALSSNEVYESLGRFRDGYLIDQSARRELAMAIRLQILLGYPDGTLRPLRQLTHAESAALFYRSAMIRAAAAPNPFSPDGDGVEDQTVISLTSLRNNNVTSWGLVITLSDQKTVVRSFNGAGAIPPDVAWDGRDWAGRRVLPGTYYYRPYLIDRVYQTIPGVMKPLTVEATFLAASLRPTVATPGQLVMVTADTGGQALLVTAHFASPESTAVRLRPLYPTSSNVNHWEGAILVPGNQPNGPVPVYVKALFPAKNRQVQLSLTVYNPIWLEARAVPDRLPAGAVVTLFANTSPGITTVTAFWPGGPAIPLTSSGGGGWQARWQIPPDTLPKRYDVEVRGRDGSRTVSATVPVHVDLSQPQLQIYLSD